MLYSMLSVIQLKLFWQREKNNSIWNQLSDGLGGKLSRPYGPCTGPCQVQSLVATVSASYLLYLALEYSDAGCQSHLNSGAHHLRCPFSAINRDAVYSRSFVPLERP